MVRGEGTTLNMVPHYRVLGVMTRFSGLGFRIWRYHSGKENEKYSVRGYTKSTSPHVCPKSCSACLRETSEK